MHVRQINLKYAVEGTNQVPRRSIDKAAPKVNEGNDEVNEQDRQMDTM